MTTMIQKIGTIEFPIINMIDINMMPFIVGANYSIPRFLHGYLPVVEMCDLTPGDIAYLTIHESWVEHGKTQRRAGIHTDATSGSPWGGGGGWGKSGVWMGSSDGDCLMWDYQETKVDAHGGLVRPPDDSILPLRASENTLYRMTDRTPHESLPAIFGHWRQFVRVVGPEVGVWYSKHSTPNPFGVLPNCPIVETSKFMEISQ